jgi:hypothetical protein
MSYFRIKALDINPKASAADPRNNPAPTHSPPSIANRVATKPHKPANILPYTAYPNNHSNLLAKSFMTELLIKYVTFIGQFLNHFTAGILNMSGQDIL